MDMFDVEAQIDTPDGIELDKVCLCKDARSRLASIASFKGRIGPA